MSLKIGYRKGSWMADGATEERETHAQAGAHNGWQMAAGGATRSVVALTLAQL